MRRLHGAARGTAAMLLLAALSAFCVACAAPDADTAARFHTSTSWRVTTSEGYDALCIMNALGGDPFYTQYYGRSAAQVRAGLSGDAVRAAERLFDRKRQFGFILSAFTTLLVSTGPAETIDDVIAAFERPRELFARYRETTYYRLSHELLFRLALRRDLLIVLRELRDAGFADWRMARRGAQLGERIEQIESVVAAADGYDFVPLVERLTGIPLPSDTITVYVQAYARPHASRLTGTAFITDYTYPDEIIFRNTIHELFHPSVEWSRPEMKELVRTLRRVPSLVQAFDDHDPVYGYNQFQGYVEENIVRMLEQWVAERVGLGMGDPYARWRMEDGGMHVLAPVLYTLAREHGLDEWDGTIGGFLTEHVVGREDRIQAMIAGL